MGSHILNPISRTEDEMVGWHHWLNRHEFEPSQGDSEGQGSLVCCSPWGCEASDTSDWTLVRNVFLLKACYNEATTQQKACVWLNHTDSILSAQSQAHSPAPPLSAWLSSSLLTRNAIRSQINYEHLALPSSDMKTAGMASADVDS